MGREIIFYKPIKVSKAFTIIELLVVISIISALMAITIPCLNKARISAKESQCLANSKSLVTAWSLYAGEHGGYLVGGDVLAPGKGTWVCPPIDKDGNCNEKEGFTTAPIGDKLRGIENGMLFAYLENTDVYRCPAKKKIRDNDPYYTSCIPGPMNGEEPMDEDADLRVKKISNIVRPAEKIVFIERNSSQGWRKRGFLINYNNNYWKDVLGVWHNDNSSLGFADGHCNSHRWKEKRTLDWARRDGVYEKHEGSVDFAYIKAGYNPNK